MNQEFNAFDNMGGISDPEELARIEAENRVQWAKIDHLIHKTFRQTESGRELWEVWKEVLIMTPTVTPHSTQFQAGIEEGKKEFIRKIHLTIKNVERD